MNLYFSQTLCTILMNALTIENIDAAVQLLGKENDVDPTSYAYLEKLLKPYADAIENVTDIQSIVDWVPMAFMGELAAGILSDLDNMLNVEKSDDVDAVKYAVIDYILGEIISQTISYLESQQSTTILPWSIQEAIKLDGELMRITGITMETNTIPVNVTFDSNTFEHQLTQDLVAGIFAIYGAADQELQISIHGVFLTFESFQSYTKENLNAEYTVKIGGTINKFNTPSFMQGVNTGAQWMNVNNRDYWSELKKGEIYINF